MAFLSTFWSWVEPFTTVLAWIVILGLFSYYVYMVNKKGNGPLDR